MTPFYYTALNHKGESDDGVVPATNEAEAIQILRARGLYPTRISKTPGGETASTTTRKPADGPFIPGLVFAVLLVIGVLWLFFASFSEHIQERRVRRSAEAPEAQTVIIEGKKYTITITPQR
jgi:hypothetical protein